MAAVWGIHCKKEKVKAGISGKTLIFLGHTHGIEKFLGQGSNPSCSHDYTTAATVLDPYPTCTSAVTQAAAPPQQKFLARVVFK